MPQRLVVLVTEASHPMGYHLLNLLGNGDTFGPDQTVDLMLCDRREREAELLEVAMELRDCAFPLVSSVRTSCDFCSAFMSADIAVVLPFHLQSLAPVSLNFTILEARSFPSLEGALNKHNQNSHFKHAKKVSPKGPMSGAIMIANYISDTYATVIKEVSPNPMNTSDYYWSRMHTLLEGCKCTEAGREYLYYDLDSQGHFPTEDATVEEVYNVPVEKLKHAFNMGGLIGNPVSYQADNFQNCMMVICDQDDSNYTSCHDERKTEFDALLSRL